MNSGKEISMYRLQLYMQGSVSVGILENRKCEVYGKFLFLGCIWIANIKYEPLSFDRCNPTKNIE